VVEGKKRGHTKVELDRDGVAGSARKTAVDERLDLAGRHQAPRAHRLVDVEYTADVVLFSSRGVSTAEAEEEEGGRRTWKITFMNHPQLTFLAVWKRSSSCCFFPSSVVESGKRLCWLTSRSFFAIELWLLLRTKRSATRRHGEGREETYREKMMARAIVAGGMRKRRLLATTSGWISPFEKVRMGWSSSSLLPCRVRGA
jgi:hypothetical protein